MGDSNSLKLAEQKIETLGLPLPEQPVVGEDEPQWPENVAHLTPEQVGHHLTWWGGWASFARWHLARAETNLGSWQSQYNHEERRFMFKSSGDYATVTEAKAAFSQRPDSSKQTKKIVEEKAIVTTLKSLLEGYEGKYAIVSREISRQQGDFDHSKKDTRGAYYG